MSGFTANCRTCGVEVNFKSYPVPGFDHIHFSMHDACGSIWYMAQDYESGEYLDLTPQHIEAIANQYGIKAKIVD